MSCLLVTLPLEFHGCHVILQVIVPALKECALDGEIKSVDENTIVNMLSNIEDIYRFHVKFNAALRKATFPYPYYTHCIGEIFLQHVSLLIVCSILAINFV